MDEIWMHLLNEKKILNEFVKRNKKEHKSNIIQKKLQRLEKLTNKFCITNTNENKESLKSCCLELYTLATSNIALKHYIAYTYIILGLCARIHFLVCMIKCNITDEIDDIFL